MTAENNFVMEQYYTMELWAKYELKLGNMGYENTRGGHRALQLKYVIVIWVGPIS